MFAFGAVTWLLLALEVQGAGACPEPAMVERRVRDLTSSEPTPGEPDRAGVADRAVLRETPDGALEIVWTVSGAERDRKSVPASVR